MQRKVDIPANVIENSIDFCLLEIGSNGEAIFLLFFEAFANLSVSWLMVPLMKTFTYHLDFFDDSVGARKVYKYLHIIKSTNIRQPSSSLILKMRQIFVPQFETVKVAFSISNRKGNQPSNDWRLIQSTNIFWHVSTIYIASRLR